MQLLLCSVPIHLCVFVPALNTGDCMCILGNDGRDKAQRAGGLLHTSLSVEGLRTETQPVSGRLCWA